MGVTGNTGSNATPPTPAIAPGSEEIDPRAVAEALARRWPAPAPRSHPGGWDAVGGVDPRLTALVPGFDAPFFQAGLAGYSDAAMRLVARRHGCPFCVTEALLDRTMLAGGRGFTKADLGELHDNVPGGADDHPLACQIMGSDPREMSAAALKAAEQGARGEKAYRRLAYARQGVFPTTHTGARDPVNLPRDQRQHLRLPGGEQLGVLDPTEGLEEDDACGVADGGEDSCGVDALDAQVREEMLRDDASDEAAREESGAPSVSTPALSFEVIDVNLACPVKKISAKARGGHWLAEPAGAIRILEAVREAVPAHIPCTVKLRRSFDDTPEMVENFERIFDAAYRMGYAWATVHARTVQQKYVGPSRWTFLRDLCARHPDKIVFGSGDVWTADDIFRMIRYAGVTAVSVARGCIGNPWIFRQARDMLAGRAPRPPSVPEQRAVLEEHFALALRVNAGMRHAEEHTGKTMRKFGIRFAAHHPRGDEVRHRFIGVSTLEDWRAVLDEFYAESSGGSR